MYTVKENEYTVETVSQQMHRAAVHTVLAELAALHPVYAGRLCIQLYPSYTATQGLNKYTVSQKKFPPLNCL